MTRFFRNCPYFGFNVPVFSKLPGLLQRPDFQIFIISLTILRDRCGWMLKLPFGNVILRFNKKIVRLIFIMCITIICVCIQMQFSLKVFDIESINNDLWQNLFHKTDSLSITQINNFVKSFIVKVVFLFHKINNNYEIIHSYYKCATDEIKNKVAWVSNNATDKRDT